MANDWVNAVAMPVYSLFLLALGYGIGATPLLQYVHAKKDLEKAEERIAELEEDVQTLFHANRNAAAALRSALYYTDGNSDCQSANTDSPGDSGPQ
jgi:hypothetical protein